MILNADEELDAWHLANAEAAGRRQAAEEAAHRCPPDMPPCPVCQARQEAEDEREYGNQ